MLTPEENPQLLELDPGLTEAESLRLEIIDDQDSYLKYVTHHARRSGFTRYDRLGVKDAAHAMIEGVAELGYLLEDEHAPRAVMQMAKFLQRLDIVQRNYYLAIRPRDIVPWPELLPEQALQHMCHKYDDLGQAAARAHAAISIRNLHFVFSKPLG